MSIEPKLNEADSSQKEIKIEVTGVVLSFQIRSMKLKNFDRIKPIIIWPRLCIKRGLVLMYILFVFPFLIFKEHSIELSQIIPLSSFISSSLISVSMVKFYPAKHMTGTL